MERKDPKGPRHIRDALQAFLKESGLRRPPSDERVFRAWRDALGPEWAPRAVPVSFRGGQLTVEVDSATHLHELKNFRAENYRNRANSSLGNDRIRRVVIKLKG